jgi:hypothetical protein
MPSFPSKALLLTGMVQTNHMSSTLDQILLIHPSQTMEASVHYSIRLITLISIDWFGNFLKVQLAPYLGFGV